MHNTVTRNQKEKKEESQREMYNHAQQSRIYRAQRQPIELVARCADQVIVKGMSSCYTVCLSRATCNCPDFQRRGPGLWCKHLCYISLCVLDHPHLFLPLVADSIAEKKPLEEPLSQTEREADCGICFEAMDTLAYVRCPRCLQVAHRRCLIQWTMRHHNCIYCRGDLQL